MPKHRWGRGGKDHGDEIRQIHRLLGQISNKRGVTNENRFFDAFAENFKMPKWFLGVRRATPEEDRSGVDAIIFTDVGEIPLQIKSTWTSKKRFEARGNTEHICCIVVNEMLQPSQIRHLTYCSISNFRDARKRFQALGKPE